MGAEGSTLVTGGLGYIGSHVVRRLLELDRGVVVVDDASGTRQRHRDDVATEHLDLARAGAEAELAEIMATHAVSSVVHLAARKKVDESVADPLGYVRTNTLGTACVLDAMRRVGVPSLVFSSTAAVYGEVRDDAVRETDATEPINPYGRSKLAAEWLIAASARAYGIHAISLRYFNVGGAGDPSLRDDAGDNLIPITLRRIASGIAPVINGDDYPTPDGTCVRDFIHVVDVARAHTAALARISDLADPHTVINIGSGSGASVRELVDLCLARSGSGLRPVLAPRRAGDPAQVIAAIGRASRLLGWSPERGIEEIVRDT